MLILAIDTSCDETSVAILWKEYVLANVVSSQIDIHKEWGGVVPNLARRAHEENIDSVLSQAIKRTQSRLRGILRQEYQKPFTVLLKKFEKAEYKFSLGLVDAIAVTQGPGLAPALEVGVRTARALASKWNKPLVAVNHMEGHIYANMLRKVPKQKEVIPKIVFPALALLVSGKHTELVYMPKNNQYEKIGKTLDDAAGEAFDKVARMLGLGYPGGPILEELAHEGDPFAFDFPVPMKQSTDLNFSYSGLKTAVLYTVRTLKEQKKLDKKTLQNICASFQRVAVEHLVLKLKRALDNRTHVKTVLLGGGVVNNAYARTELRKVARAHNIPMLSPQDKLLRTDNAAMIGIVGYYKAQRKEFVKDIDALDREPRLSL